MGSATSAALRTMLKILPPKGVMVRVHGRQQRAKQRQVDGKTRVDAVNARKRL
jgi:hypothetical protein